MKENRYIQSISILAILMFTQPLISSLHEAVENCNVKLVKELLDSGVDKKALNAALQRAVVALRWS